MKLIHQWEGGLHKHDTHTHIFGFYSSIDMRTLTFNEGNVDHQTIQHLLMWQLLWESYIVPPMTSES